MPGDKPNAGGYCGPDEAYLLKLDPKLRKGIVRFVEDLGVVVDRDGPFSTIILSIQIKRGKIGKANIRVDLEV